MSKIHKTAIIGDNCIIGKNVEIGAYSIIEDQAKIGQKLFADQILNRYHHSLNLENYQIVLKDN